jgi:hypothetical protein
MGLGRDRWVEVTPSRFAHEREGLEYVRAALPDEDPYRAWTGVEIITDRGRSLDVDLLVIAPAGLFVVELKAWSGRITGDRYSWAIRYERGVRTESNPWRLNNAKARELKSLLRDTLRRQIPVRAARRGDVRSKECVVHRGEPLLAVQHNVLRPAIAAVSVDRLAGERFEVLPLTLPEEQTSNVVVEEDRAHKLTDVPRLPFELALEIWDDEAAFFEPVNQCVEADMVRLLNILHFTPSLFMSPAVIVARTNIEEL